MLAGEGKRRCVAGRWHLRKAGLFKRVVYSIIYNSISAAGRSMVHGPWSAVHGAARKAKPLDGADRTTVAAEMIGSHLSGGLARDWQAEP